MDHHWREDPRGTPELLGIALGGDEDDEATGEALAALHWRGTREVLDAAEHLLHDPGASRRARGALILGQLGLPRRTFPGECLRLLTELLRREPEPSVLEAAAVALGHLGEPGAVDALVRLREHPSAQVRFGVVFGLTGQEHPDAVATLITLSADEDEDVRNWATFNLGSQLELDTPSLREALLRRLADPHQETRGEALVGLARRGDPRVLEPLLAALAAPCVMVLVVEAAVELKDPRVYPSLLQLRDRPGEADHYFLSVLDDAIQGYAPAPARAPLA